MRTTLTTDDDLAAILHRESKHKGVSFKELVNSTLRCGLGNEQVTRSIPCVVTRPHAIGFKPGIDLDKLSQLVDELEAEAFATRLQAKP